MSITFSAHYTTLPKESPNNVRTALKIPDDHVTCPCPQCPSYRGAQPELASQSWCPHCKRHGALEAKKTPEVLITNFTEEYQTLNKGASIALHEELRGASDVITVTDSEPGTDARKTGKVNGFVTPLQRLFSEPSKLRQMPLASETSNYHQRWSRTYPTVTCLHTGATLFGPK